jgi:hypothetical protein
MPTRNRRINMVLDDTLFEAIEELASKRGTSLSAVAKDLVTDALEMQEDIGLQLIAAEREANYEPESSISHDDTWAAE